MSGPVTERAYYANAFESLGRVVKARKPELIATLRAQGIDLESPPHTLPVDSWKLANEATARELFPDQSLEVGLYRVGQLVML